MKDIKKDNMYPVGVKHQNVGFNDKNVRNAQYKVSLVIKNYQQWLLTVNKQHHQ